MILLINMTTFVYKNIASFLKAYIEQLPKKGRGEASRIAANLKVSTTLVSQVLNGQKYFTHEQVLKLVAYVGLVGPEAEYIVFVSHYERAGTQELKDFWNNQLHEVKNKSVNLSKRLTEPRRISEEDRVHFYSSYIYSAIRLYTSLDDKGKNLQDIANRFDISLERARKILDFLTRTGLCKSEGGQFTVGTQSTHIDKTSPHFLKHHNNWRFQSILRSESISDQELMFTSPVSLSKDDFLLLREEMTQFIKSFLEKIKESPAEDIACFNLDFFWIKK